jgi:cystathionine beta-lyase/cystathionine gamma-synthase
MEDLSYILHHLGEDNLDAHGAVVPPLVQTANFRYQSVEAMRRALQEEDTVPLYTRGLNPTVALLAEKLAALEGAEAALVTASGSAAVSKAVLSVVKTGDHIVSVRKPYSWTGKLFTDYLPRFGIETTFVDGTDLEAFRAALTPQTRLVYLESPNSFTFELQDIAAVCTWAKQHRLHTIVDNSYSTGLYQQPIALGADTVVHSATKYYSGHSDVVSGVICGRRTHLRALFHYEFMTLGGVASPFTAWLLLKGLRTLELRLERSAATTSAVVEYLLSHPAVERVHWPGHPSHPQYALAQKQMTRSSGLFSVVLRTDAAGATRFAEALRRFRLAVSWGGYESVVYPAVVAHAGAYTAGDLPIGLCRLSVGLEPAEVLIEDLAQALRKMG